MHLQFQGVGNKLHGDRVPPGPVYCLVYGVRAYLVAVFYFGYLYAVYGYKGLADFNTLRVRRLSFLLPCIILDNVLFFMFRNIFIVQTRS